MSLITKFCMSCGCPSSTSAPWVPYFMCCVLPCQVRFGSLRAQVGFGSRLVGCVRRFRLPPPPGRCFGPSSVRFSVPLPFQGSPVPGQGCRVGVFLFSFFFCVPLLGFLLGKCHLIFIVVPCSFHFTYPAAAGCVCVPSE